MNTDDLTLNTVISLIQQAGHQLRGKSITEEQYEQINKAMVDFSMTVEPCVAVKPAEPFTMDDAAEMMALQIKEEIDNEILDNIAVLLEDWEDMFDKAGFEAMPPNDEVLAVTTCNIKHAAQKIEDVKIATEQASNSTTTFKNAMKVVE